MIHPSNPVPWFLFAVSKFEIECLLKKFRELTKTKLERTKFRDILHKDFDMTDDIIMDRGLGVNKLFSI